MLGEKRIHEITDSVLVRSTANETEVVILAEESALTRYANSAIHQNVSWSDAEARVRVAIEKRVGVATTNDLSSAALAAACTQATEMARLRPPNPQFPGLPAPTRLVPVAAFSEATAACTPERRADAIGAICRQATAAGLAAAGAFNTQIYEIAVANSHGLFAYFPTTRAELTVVVMSGDGSGYASALALSVDDIQPDALAAEAIARALKGRSPRDIAPGVYPVVLETYAVDDFLHMFTNMAFGALAFQEGRSFLAGRLGQPLMDPRVTIWDDGWDTKGLPLPFDFEGVPKSHVWLIERGIARGVVWDRYTAAREPKADGAHMMPISTGHALPVPNLTGPLPSNLFFGPGDASREELIAGLDKGLLVTRFHYTRPVHPAQAVVTGMTRDGTYWVEKGEIAYPVKNLRFTQSYLQALNQVEAIGRETRLYRGVNDWGADSVPALRLSGFNFTGVTEF
mgnify:FL=1